MFPKQVSYSKRKKFLHDFKQRKKHNIFRLIQIKSKNYHFISKNINENKNDLKNQAFFCKYDLKTSDLSQWQSTIREREKGVKKLSLKIPKFMHINRQWTSGEDIETSIKRIDSRAHHTQKTLQHSLSPIN